MLANLPRSEEIDTLQRLIDLLAGRTRTPREESTYFTASKRLYHLRIAERDDARFGRDPSD